MKKIFFMMLAAVLFAACSNDDDDKKAPEAQVIDFADYSKSIGISYAQMLSTYGEPGLAFDGFYSYELADGKTESLILMTNTENNKVYCTTQVLVEDAYKFEDIYNYFASKYTVYKRQDAGVVDEDGEEYEVEASAVFGNAEKEEDATLLITVSSNSSVYYLDPKNMPAEPEGADFSNVAPEDVPGMFLGRSWEDVEDEYGESIEHFNGVLMINVEDNDYYTCIYLGVEDGIVTMVQLLFDDLDDDAVIAYFETLGYIALDCGEEEGVHTYLFMNADTGDMFTYTNPIVTFVYVDPDAEDVGDEEEDYED